MRLSYIIHMLFFMIATGIVQAQSEGQLKTTLTTINGDEINGYIKLNSLPSRITIFYLPGDSLTMDTRLVRTMNVQSVGSIGSSSENDENPVFGKPSLKYFNNSSFGILSGKSNDDSPPLSSLSIETVNGITLYRYLAVGVGIAYDRYNTTATLPFFLSLRGDILDRPFTPFYFIDAGYGPAWDSMEDENNWQQLETEGGFMFHTGGGIKVYSGSRINVMVSLGYKLQRVAYNTVEWTGSLRVTDRTFNRLSLRMGIGF